LLQLQTPDAVFTVFVGKILAVPGIVASVEYGSLSYDCMISITVAMPMKPQGL
jgi:hypothetical protein